MCTNNIVDSVTLQAFLFHKLVLTYRNADLMKLKIFVNRGNGRSRSSDDRKTTKSEIFKPFAYHASTQSSSISMYLQLFCLEMLLIQTNALLKNN